MKTKFIILVLSSLIFISSKVLVAETLNYPLAPNLSLTPGKLCDRPSSKRYPEGIAYCDRDVSYEQKEVVMLSYDHQLGFSVTKQSREDFKIDHFIPLCAGGSNDNENLWPQHKNVYLETDPIEPLICEKMALGLLKQKDAILLIKDLKTRQKKISQIKAILNKLK